METIGNYLIIDNKNCNKVQTITAANLYLWLYIKLTLVRSWLGDNEHQPDILKLGSVGVGTGPGVNSGRSFLKPATTRGAGDCSPTSIASPQHLTNNTLHQNKTIIHLSIIIL